MKRFRCCCGNEVFFENTYCGACHRVLGFDPGTREIHTLQFRSVSSYQSRVDSRNFRLCANFVEHDVCNWLIEESDGSRFCQGCRLNRTIPDLDSAINLVRWREIEKAKKRLLYTLYTLRLPIVDRTRMLHGGLSFDFMENSRTDQHNVEDTVTTGHLNGVITINVLEADRSYREKIREDMQEPYRTLLGHFRHEIGHYYWEYLFRDPDLRARFREVFGSEEIPYSAALERYYRHGPSSGWQTLYISAYAAAHPLEDWAETWSHYLHMQDMLETAREWNLVMPAQADGFDSDLNQWIELSVIANELNRCMGLVDVYPFVITPGVRKKLAFIHQLVEDSAASNGASAFPGKP